MNDIDQTNCDYEQHSVFYKEFNMQAMDYESEHG